MCETLKLGSATFQSITTACNCAQYYGSVMVNVSRNDSNHDRPLRPEIATADKNVPVSQKSYIVEIERLHSLLRRARTKLEIISSEVTRKGAL